MFEEETDVRALAKVTILEFMAGRWPYTIDNSTSFDEKYEFGKFGPIIQTIAEKWKEIPDSKKHKIKDYIEALNNPEIKRLLADAPMQGGGCPPLPNHLHYPPELAASACQWLHYYIAFSKK